MSRVALPKAKIIWSAVLIAILIAGGSWLYSAKVSNSAANKTIVKASHQTTQLSYRGQNGSTALVLLKQHAQVQTKHYSFGDLVVAINGVVGNGPKYWTFYINGKQATVGANAYVTKDSDTLMWRLQ